MILGAAPVEGGELVVPAEDEPEDEAMVIDPDPVDPIPAAVVPEVDAVFDALVAVVCVSI